MKQVFDRRTALVLNGIPYTLAHYEGWCILNPCNCCDLSHICLKENREAKLIDLCSPYPGDESYFFVKDWNTMDEHLQNYIDSSIEDSNAY